MSRMNMSTLIRNAFLSAGIKRVSAHSLRRYYPNRDGRSQRKRQLDRPNVRARTCKLPRSIQQTHRRTTRKIVQQSIRQHQSVSQKSNQYTKKQNQPIAQGAITGQGRLRGSRSPKHARSQSTTRQRLQIRNGDGRRKTIREKVMHPL